MREVLVSNNNIQRSIIIFKDILDVTDFTSFKEEASQELEIRQEDVVTFYHLMRDIIICLVI